MKKITLHSFFALWICALFFISATGAGAQGDIRSSSQIPDLKLQIPIDKIIGAGNTQLQSSATTPHPNARLPVGKLSQIAGNELAQGGGLGTYVSVLSQWLVGAISLLAVIFLMAGGIVWLTAAGNSQQVNFAKKLITDTLVALLITLSIYIILSTISKNLVELRLLAPGGISTVQKK
ncbi:hypothetical protein HYW94_01770 [Candidatus Uhrbacteria bacterium]|nr:hypothetical protein [Candidatus Uhrbacteria bacterium]